MASDGSKVTEQVIGISSELSGLTSDIVNYAGEVDALRKLAIERTDWLKTASDSVAQQLQQQQRRTQQLEQQHNNSSSTSSNSRKVNSHHSNRCMDLILRIGPNWWRE